MEEKIYQHGIRFRLLESLRSRNVKTAAALLLIEMLLFLYVASKGLGIQYFMMTCFIMVLTVAASFIVFYIGADRHLLILILLLMNIGFTVQKTELQRRMQIFRYLGKFALALAAALAAGFIYQYVEEIIARDSAAFVIMAIQILLCMALYILGIETGSAGGQGATLTLKVAGIPFTPFEIVKILYLFAAAALLCKDKTQRLYIGRWMADRELVLVIYTLVLSVFFILCRELGTLLVIYATGILMLLIFGRHRFWSMQAAVISVAGFVLCWAVCGQVIYPKMVAGEMALPSLLGKLAERFGTALHPEQSMFDAGYQGTLALQAIASGGCYGIATERHRMKMPEAASDFIFANVTQTCGFFMGAVVLICFFALLKRGTAIAASCEDVYFQGVAMGITLLITVESILHIGYNIAVFPITGIPLYFVSQGFTAVMTSMILAAVLLVISAGMVKRRVG